MEWYQYDAEHVYLLLLLLLPLPIKTILRCPYSETFVHIYDDWGKCLVSHKFTLNSRGLLQYKIFLKYPSQAEISIKGIFEICVLRAVCWTFLVIRQHWFILRCDYRRPQTDPWIQFAADIWLIIVSQCNNGLITLNINDESVQLFNSPCRYRNKQWSRAISFIGHRQSIVTYKIQNLKLIAINTQYFLFHVLPQDLVYWDHRRNGLHMEVDCIKLKAAKCYKSTIY